MGKILIVGSGISGCTTAFELAQQGNTVEIIESSNSIGGKVLSYGCKATDECSRCGVCVAHTEINNAFHHHNVNINVGATINSVVNNGKIAANITINNPSIDYNKCISCDSCIHACPTNCITKYKRGELVQYIINYDHCLLQKGQQCTVCSDVCPTHAILSTKKESELTITADTALIATGHKIYDAEKKVRFGYGRIKNVITGLEAEEILKRQTYLGEPSNNIAFVQCVGSRDPQIGRNYCSSICCAYALRLAKMIKYYHKEAQITIYYIDIQNFDKVFTSWHRELVKSGVNFVRGIPFNIEQTNNGKLKLHIENMDNSVIVAEHDIAVLSVGLGPADDSKRMKDLFNLETDEFGFFSSKTKNVFVSGTCAKPQSIPESMALARAIAHEMDKLSHD